MRRLAASIRIVRARWRSGFVSLVEVLDAERRLHRAEQQALQARVAASTDLVALFKALGGDWNARTRGAWRRCPGCDAW